MVRWSVVSVVRFLGARWRAQPARAAMAWWWWGGALYLLSGRVPRGKNIWRDAEHSAVWEPRPSTWPRTDEQNEEQSTAWRQRRRPRREAGKVWPDWKTEVVVMATQLETGDVSFADLPPGRGCSCLDGRGCSSCKSTTVPTRLPLTALDVLCYYYYSTVQYSTVQYSTVLLYYSTIAGLKR